MRVLVTGASGFLGRFVVAELVRCGIETVATARSACPEIAGARWIETDLLQPRACDDLMREVAPSHLVHLAWYAKPGLFWRALENLDWAAATIQLMRSFAERGGQGAIFAGSCAEYGWDHALLAETDVPAPATFYGRIKDATRSAVMAAAHEFGVPCGWARVFWLYGPHEANGRLVSDIVSALLRGDHVACSDGLQRRDFLHVVDVAAAMVAGLRSGWNGPLNIGSGQGVAVREIVETIGTLTGRADLLRIGARPAVAGEPPMIIADITQLREKVGFSPRFTLCDGLSDTVDWWKRTQASARQRASA